MKKVLFLHWKENLGVFLLMAGAGISTTLAGLSNSEIVNALIHFDQQAFLSGILKLLLFHGLFLLFTYFHIIRSSQVSQKMSTYLRASIAKKIEKTDYQGFHEASVGTYSSWLTNDITQIEQSGFAKIYELTAGLFATIFAVIALFLIHWSLLLITGIEVLLLLSLPKLFQKIIQTNAKKVTDENEVFLSKITDVLSGFDTFFVFQKLPFITNEIQHAAKKLAAKKVQQSKAMAKVAISGGIGNVFSQLAIFAFTGYLALIQQVSIGTISSTNNFASTIFNTIGNISQYIASIQSTAPIFEKFEKLEAAIEPEDKALSPDSTLQIQELAYSYETKAVFTPITTVFKQQHKYAIIGKSGAGKTTFFNLLNGKLKNYEGSIRLGNQELRHLNSRQLYSKLLYLDQTPYILTGTIRENLQLGEQYSDSCLWQALEEAGLKEAVAQLPDTLDSFIGENGRLLSGGQKQRLALARGFLRNKEILLIDEGTSSLDQQTAQQIEQMLLSKKELTVIMVTHHLSAEIEQQLDGVLELAPS